MSDIENNAAEVPANASSLDVTNAKIYRKWKYAAPLIGCRYDPSGRYVFATAMDQSIQRWDLQSDQHATFQGHESWLRGIGFSSDGTTMYSGGYDGRLCFWDRDAEAASDETIKPARSIEAHQGWIRWLAVHPQGHLLATAGNDKVIKLWSTESGELVRELGPHDKHIYSLLFHPDGNLLLSGDLSGIVRQWDLESGAEQRRFEAQALHTYHGGQQVDYGGVRCMALRQDGQQIAFGGLHKATNPFAGVQEPLVLVFDWETGEPLRTHEATDIPQGIVWRLWFESDGTLTGGIGGNAGYLVFWGEDKTDFHKLKFGSPVLDMDHHPRKHEIVTAHHDGRIQLSQLVAEST